MNEWMKWASAIWELIGFVAEIKKKKNDISIWALAKGFQLSHQMKIDQFHINL